MEYFEKLSEKDSSCSQIVKSITCYRQHLEFNKKIEDMYKVIEEALDLVIKGELMRERNMSEDNGMLTPGVIALMKGDIGKTKKGHRYTQSESNPCPKELIIKKELTSDYYTTKF